jgi:hypothetical protein
MNLRSGCVLQAAFEDILRPLGASNRRSRSVLKKSPFSVDQTHSRPFDERQLPEIPPMFIVS